MSFNRASFSEGRRERPLVTAWLVPPEVVKQLYEKLRAGVSSCPDTYGSCSSNRSMTADTQKEAQLLICATDNEGQEHATEWLCLTSGADCMVDRYSAVGLKPKDSEIGLWAYVDRLRKAFNLEKVDLDAGRGDGEHTWKGLLREASAWLRAPVDSLANRGTPEDSHFRFEVVWSETCRWRREYERRRDQ